MVCLGRITPMEKWNQDKHLILYEQINGIIICWKFEITLLFLGVKTNTIVILAIQNSHIIFIMGWGDNF